jgi:hypothetical protein
LTTTRGLVGYVDSDYAGDLESRRSLIGYVFTISGCAVSWKARLQATIALSTTEAEYMTVSEAAKEAIWLRGLYSELCGISSCVTMHAIVKVLFALLKIRCFVREQSTLTSGIILFEMLLLEVVLLKYARFILMTIPLI